MEQMARPKTLGELQQILGALSWIRAHLPDYARITAPLQDLLDEGLARLPARSRRYSDAVRLQWTDQHDRAWEATKNMVSNAVKLAYREPSWDVRVYTDASDTHWAVACVQETPLRTHTGRWLSNACSLSRSSAVPSAAAAGVGPCRTKRRTRSWSPSTSSTTCWYATEDSS